MKANLTKLLLCLFLVLLKGIAKADNSYTVFQKDSIVQKRVPPSNFIGPKYKNVEVYKVSNVPDPKEGSSNGFVSDPNDYISASEEYKINTILWELEGNSTAQVAVVILKSIGSEVPKDFAVKLFENWGIGQADKDNGLLILTVIDQRRTEFEVGYGLEPILTDLICHRIGTDEIVPNFKRGEFGQGLIAASNRVKQIIEKPENIEEVYSQDISYSEKRKSSLGSIYNEYLEEQDPSPYKTFLTFLPLLFILSVYGGFNGLLFYRMKEKIAIIDNSKEDYYDKYNELKDTAKGTLGCLSIFLGLLFPIYAYLRYITRRKKLKEYRYAPRFSRMNGEKMELLNAWAENKFLKEGEILEEKLESAEYDVWATADESDVMVLEYQGSSRKYSDCKECGYKTYGRSSTRIIRSATYERSGKKEEIYLCRNCNYTDSVIVTIPKKVRSQSSSSSSSSSWSSSSSSSSWGGGSSGGGGAGVSW
ncbi:YgcG family protein [uncultured Tenacibaculum sp.]|uniref:TPM domain-containing protein n=1 Tax=uncultured Tenacibaculum sp. TaxID=174713 RepID=UPI00260406CA|nr:TPM domain-containing protein [uncultured Tenacibaculum sp.]